MLRAAKILTTKKRQPRRRPLSSSIQSSSFSIRHMQANGTSSVSLQPPTAFAWEHAASRRVDDSTNLAEHRTTAATTFFRAETSFHIRRRNTQSAGSMNQTGQVPASIWFTHRGICRLGTSVIHRHGSPSNRSNPEINKKQKRDAPFWASVRSGHEVARWPPSRSLSLSKKIPQQNSASRWL